MDIRNDWLKGMTWIPPINMSVMCFVLGGMLGAISFFLLYGASFIDPTYDTWLLNIGSDLSIDYIGWQYYRTSSWRFPLALIENAIYPDAFSTIYTGCSPLLAVFWKLFSGILPVTFQFIGIIAFITYVLNGAFAAYLVWIATNKPVNSILGSVFFILSPSVVGKMYAQCTLTYHFIILMAIILYWKSELFYDKKPYVHMALWSFVIGLGALTHSYYVPMVFCFMFSFYCFLAFKRKSILYLFGSLVPCLWALGMMWIFGMFYGTHSYSAAGFGTYNFRLNGFFITGNTSYIQQLLGFKSPFGSDYEGYGYLGAGILFLLTIVILSLVKQNDSASLLKGRMIDYLGPCSILFLAAINPSITINETTIFSIQYPQFLTDLFSIFRANGRFIWPIIYCLMLGLIVYVSGKMKKAGVVILLIAIILQVFDLSEYFWRKRNIYMYHLSSLAKPALMNEVWNTLSDAGYKEIFIFNGESEDMPIHRTYSVKKLTGLSEYALLNHMVTNDIYCARKDSKRINDDRRKEWENIKKGKADETRIYIFPEYPAELDGRLKVIEADGMYIGIARGIMERE